MKKIHILMILLIMFCLPFSAQAKLNELIMAGPQSCVTHPLIYIKEAGLLDHVAENVKLIIWSNPDQLRSIIAGKQAHFSAVPSYVAANFYNKGVPLKLLNISTWGILWIISSDPEVKSLADLKNEEVALTFRRDLPDLAFTSLVRDQGFDPTKDFNLRYLPNFNAVAQELISGRTKHAMLAEPIASIALLKSKKMKGKSPKLFRAVDIQKEWGSVYNTKPRMAEAGICAMPEILDNPEVVMAFQKAYEKAIIFCKSNPKKAAKIVVKYLKKGKPGPIASALKNSKLEFVTALEAKPELLHFYKILMKLNPAKTGGKLPDDGFYWKDR